MTADYWATQICAPVQFHDAVRAAANSADVDYLAEAGPRVRAALARQAIGTAIARHLRLSYVAGRIPTGRNCSALQRHCCVTDTRRIWTRCTASRQARCCGFRPTSSTTHSRFWFDDPIPSSHQRARGGQVHMTAPDVDRTGTEDSARQSRERGPGIDRRRGQLFGHRAGPIQAVGRRLGIRLVTSASAPGSTPDGISTAAAG